MRAKDQDLLPPVVSSPSATDTQRARSRHLSGPWLELRDTVPEMEQQ